jgi:hypothetical protein
MGSDQHFLDFFGPIRHTKNSRPNSHSRRLAVRGDRVVQLALGDQHQQV